MRDKITDKIEDLRIHASKRPSSEWAVVILALIQPPFEVSEECPTCGGLGSFNSCYDGPEDQEIVGCTVCCGSGKITHRLTIHEVYEKFDRCLSCDKRCGGIDKVNGHQIKASK